MIKRLEKKLMGLEGFNNNSVGWETYFYNRKNNPFDVTWYDMSLNYNSFPYNTDTAIVLTSYWRHLWWMKASLTNYRLTGKYVVVGYDTPFKGYEDPHPLDNKRYLPRREHYLLAHSFVFKHPTYDSPKRFGSYWDTKYAQGIVNMFPNIKYVLLGTTDCIFDRPEGINELIEILGDGDFMACASSSTPYGTATIHSSSVLFKIDAFNKYVDYMTDDFKVPMMGHCCKNFETLLHDAVIFHKLKETIAPKQPIYPKDGSIDMYSCYSQPSTWKEVLGFRNLFAEWITAAEEGLEPPDKKYVDDWEDYFYFDEGDRNGICQYYKTGDRRYLKQWWDMNNVETEKRKCLPIGAYGKEPLYA